MAVSTRLRFTSQPLSKGNYAGMNSETLRSYFDYDNVWYCMAIFTKSATECACIFSIILAR